MRWFSLCRAANLALAALTIVGLGCGGADKQAITVGTLENTAASRLLKKLGIATKTYDDQTNPYNDLALGRLDAVLLDLPIAIYMVQKNPELNAKLKFVGEPFEKGQYAIAFRKQDEALAQQFDQALERLIQNGTFDLKQIYEKWGLWNDDQKELATFESAAKAGDVIAAAPKDGPLRWGADEEGGAPYISKTKDGTYVGFEVDLAAALAKEIGRPIEYTPKNFKSLVDDLERGDIDLAMNGLEVTPDRQKIVRLSRPYYIYRLQLVTRKDDNRFSSIKDLEGK